MARRAPTVCWLSPDGGSPRSVCPRAHSCRMGMWRDLLQGLWGHQTHGQEALAMVLPAFLLTALSCVHPLARAWAQEGPFTQAFSQ